MSDKNTYQQEEQIRRYLQDEMTMEERNAFEREMQKDVFLAEAVDGFSDFPSKEIFTDVENLKTQLTHPVRSRQKIGWYAAATVLLLIASTFFLFNLKEKSDLLITENAIKTDSISEYSELIQKPDSEIVTKKKEIPAEPEVTDEEKEPISSAKEDVRNMAILEKEQKRKMLIAETNKVDTEEARQQSVVHLYSKKEQRAAEPTKTMRTKIGVSTEKKVAAFALAEEIDTTSILRPDTVVTRLLITEEISDTVGAQNNEWKDGKAVPRSGWKAYKEYLTVELQHPGIGTPDKKVVVYLSFEVDENGQPVSFRVLRSNNEKYNQAAIKIIKEGPEWKPAMADSFPKSEEVKIRLVFPPTARN